MARSWSPAASGIGDEGYFIEPTLFAGVTDDMRIARDEIFGPVLSVLKFKNVDEIIKRANDTNFGLAAAVWTRDIGQGPPLWPRPLRAGTVWINCYDVFDAAAPFGGFKESGIGRELGEAGLANLHRAEDGYGLDDLISRRLGRHVITEVSHQPPAPSGVGVLLVGCRDARLFGVRFGETHLRSSVSPRRDSLDSESRCAVPP